MEANELKTEKANVIVLYIKEILNHCAEIGKKSTKPQIELFLKILEQDKILFHFDRVHRLDTASRMVLRALENSEPIKQLFEVLSSSTSVSLRQHAVDVCFSALDKTTAVDCISNYVSHPHGTEKTLETFANGVYQSSLKFVNAYNCNNNGIARCTALEDRFNTLQFKIDEAISSGTPAGNVSKKRN